MGQYVINQPLAVVSLFGIFLSAMMAVGQFFTKRNIVSKMVFVDLFIIMAMLEVHSFFYETGSVKNSIYLQQLIFPSLFAFGPVFYFLSSMALEKKEFLKFEHLIHYIPALLSYVAAVAIARSTSPSIGNFYGNYFYNDFTMAVGAAGLLLIVIYLSLIYFMIKRNVIINYGFKGKAIKVILVLFLTTASAVVFDFFSLLFKNMIFVEIAIVVITSLVVFLFLTSFWLPEFYSDWTKNSRAEIRGRSYLSGIDESLIAEKLNHLMKQEESYKDGEISMVRLAFLVGISAHQLSEYLNDRLGKNFRSYINGLRVEKASFLLANTDMSVLEVAYDVGFQSKSVFNKSFHSQTGMSPSEFRKKSRN